MAKILSFRDLDVYKASLESAEAISALTRRFAPQARYSLTDQMRRSSRAVGALIAEAWARRRYPAASINKLNEAQAEAMETQAWLDHAYAAGYIDDDDFARADQSWQHIGGKLQRMMQRAESFKPRH